MNWEISDEDFRLCISIAKRAVAVAQQNGIDYDQHDALMDVHACHANGCPLNLKELLEADNGNFGHDVFGIRHHINRRTGKLEDFFLPRFAQQ